MHMTRMLFHKNGFMYDKQPMETQVLEDKVIDDPMDLANGQEIHESFPGAEMFPAVSNKCSDSRQIWNNLFLIKLKYISNFKVFNFIE
jgi:hypothetical protein